MTKFILFHKNVAITFLVFFCCVTSFGQTLTLNEFVLLPNKSRGEIIEIMRNKSFIVSFEESDMTASRSNPEVINIETVLFFGTIIVKSFFDVLYKNESVYKCTLKKSCPIPFINCNTEKVLSVHFLSYSNYIQYTELSTRLWREGLSFESKKNKSNLDETIYVKKKYDNNIEYTRLTFSELKVNFKSSEKLYSVYYEKIF